MMAEDLFSPRVLQGETRCLSNILRMHREAVLDAVQASGVAVEWRAEPNEWMCPTQAHRYGSIWSAEQDVSAFWTAYKRIRTQQDEIDNRRERP